MTAAVRNPGQVALRTVAALGGGYAFGWGFVSLGIVLLFAAGVSFHDAEHLLSMLVFLVYPCAFLWAFVAPSLGRVGLVLFGGGLLMAAIASLLQSRLVGLVD